MGLLLKHWTVLLLFEVCVVFPWNADNGLTIILSWIALTLGTSAGPFTNYPVYYPCKICRSPYLFHSFGNLSIPIWTRNQVGTAVRPEARCPR